MKRWREYSQPRRLARPVAERSRRIARQIAERCAAGDAEQPPDESPGLVVEFEPGLLPPPAPVIALNAVRAMVEQHGFPLAVAILNATQALGLLLVLAAASGCIPARQARPGAAPVELLRGSGIDTAGAEPDDRGAPQPLWPGVPRVLVAQVVDAPPDPTPSPPSAAREICSPWWAAWLAERAAEHPGATDDPGWFDVSRPPPAASDAWWGAWLAQERARCAAAEPETPTAPEGPNSWLGY